MARPPQGSREEEENLISQDAALALMYILPHHHGNIGAMALPCS